MKTKEIIDYRSKHNVLTEPLSLEELKKLSGTKKSFKLLIDLNDLIDWNIEDLNDEVSERITNSISGLVDISYSVAGRNASTDEVILKVTAEIANEDYF